MNIEEAKEYIKMIIRKQEIPDSAKALGYVYATEAIDTVLSELENKQDDINILQAQRDSMEYQFNQVKAELKKKENMYIKEYNEHMEKKRQNGVLINNEQILKRELEKKDKKLHSLEWDLRNIKRDLDFEPWSTYRVEGNILFDMAQQFENKVEREGK